jgi:hypothetical protein
MRNVLEERLPADHLVGWRETPVVDGQTFAGTYGNTLDRYLCATEGMTFSKNLHPLLAVRRCCAV